MTKIAITVSGNGISCTWGDVKISALDEVWKSGMASLGTGRLRSDSIKLKAREVETNRSIVRTRPSLRSSPRASGRFCGAVRREKAQGALSGAYCSGTRPCLGDCLRPSTRTHSRKRSMYRKWAGGRLPLLQAVDTDSTMGLTPSSLLDMAFISRPSLSTASSLTSIK